MSLQNMFFEKILISLGVDEQVTIQDACQIEHVISQES